MKSKHIPGIWWKDLQCFSTISCASLTVIMGKGDFLGLEVTLLVSSAPMDEEVVELVTQSALKLGKN